MAIEDENIAADLRIGLQTFEAQAGALPGIQAADRRETLVRQMIESIHRIKYVALIRSREISDRRSDPSSSLFDPYKAALIHFRNGNSDEAFWLVFLATHFGKHGRNGWKFLRDVYGRLGGEPWTWLKTSGNPGEFEQWLIDNQPTFDNGNYHFGNHRKYQTLNMSSHLGTGAIVRDYVQWVGANRGHALMVADAISESGDNPKQLFDYLYRSVKAVRSMGRTGAFDFLTMVGKLGLAEIEPGLPYLVGATGPSSGARLLFHNDPKAAVSTQVLDEKVAALGECLHVGMQVMEDALCNWQKSPAQFIAFRG